MDKQELLNAIEKAVREEVISLNLPNSNLNQLPSEIGRLSKIQAINFSANQINHFPSEIGQLLTLKDLDARNNYLIDLPPEIGQLSNLENLYLGGNYLSNLPPEIGQLSSLETLSVFENHLIDIPSEIGQLSNLENLYLASNHLSKLPPEIEQLTNLQYLDLSNNRLSELPPGILQLTNLQSLNLSNNKLSELPPEILQLTNLQSLNLSNNQLTQLPSAVLQLFALESLDISGNQLSEIPPGILRLTNLQSLNLSKNPLDQFPLEIQKYFANPSQAAIKIPQYYLQILEQETDRLYEAKLLIVGEGGAGKTSLAKKIENENYELDGAEKSTEGIDIIQFKFPFQNDKEFRINIWDFGGQEIYHTTHQFFLTKRSLYILVSDDRKEDTDFDYWLRAVDLLTESSPILIIKNEKQNRKREINERQLRGEFPNLEKVLDTNLADNRGLPEIKQAIQHYITTLPHVGDELPKTWIKVRKVLETDSRDYITLDEYFRICEENGFTRREDALQLSEYLHDIGVFLHFQKDSVLRKTVILKSTWVTDAVYLVLDNPKVIQNSGRFSEDDLSKIWHEDRYFTAIGELLRLMINFKLCYKIPRDTRNNSPDRDRRDRYIVPQRLDADRPDYSWDETDNLLLRYTYEFMPKGIITRFIVEMHSWIEGQSCVWKTGVVLSKDGSRAEVIEFYHLRQIRIRVSGNRCRDLLTTIRHEFDKIHSSYDRLTDKMQTLVPCNCKTCKGSQDPYFYPFDKLQERLANGKETIECGNPPYHDVSVSRLIDDINKGSRHSSKSMSDSGKYRFENPGVVQITENNYGQVIGEQHNYADDPLLKKSVAEICQILKNLHDANPRVTDAQAREIVEVEFEEVSTSKPKKWEMLRRNLLNPERWFNGGKAALLKAAEHLLEDNLWGKTAVAFLEGVAEEEELEDS